jgi:hypothetical protein
MLTIDAYRFGMNAPNGAGQLPLVINRPMPAVSFNLILKENAYVGSF